MHTIRHKTAKNPHFVSVGILTIPHMKSTTKYGDTHIMKAYVDWFEDRNVHVIPIPYNTTHHETFFNMVNGILIPGGETTYILKNRVFVETVARFLELSIHRRRYFPIWGTCFGFEVLLSVIGGITRFKRYPAQGFYPLSVTHEGRHSKMFLSFPAQYMHYLEHSKSCSNNHDYGISPLDFSNNNNLRRFFNILATSIDDNNKEYVAAIEAKHYPIYGVQWHPERQTTTGPFIDFFISELKKNKMATRPTRVIPFLRSILTPHKCIQYPEHANLLCYFFKS